MQNVVIKFFFTCKGTLRQVFICLWPEPYTLPLHTAYVYTVFTYSHREGGRGTDKGQKGQQFTIVVSKKCQNDRMCLQSINSDELLPQSPFTGQFVQMTKFCFSVYTSNQSMGKKNGKPSTTFINVVIQLSVLSAGFGNKPTDVEAYREIGLSPRRIFIVNKVKYPSCIQLNEFFIRKVSFAFHLKKFVCARLKNMVARKNLGS